MDDFDECVLAYNMFVGEAEILLSGRAANNAKNNDHQYREKVNLLVSQVYSNLSLL